MRHRRAPRRPPPPMRRCGSAVRPLPCAARCRRRGAPAAGRAPPGSPRRRCHRVPSASYSDQPCSTCSIRCDRRPHPSRPAPADQFVDEHRVAALHRTEHRPVGDGRQRRVHRLGQRGGTAVEGGGQPGGSRAHTDGRRRPRIHPAQQRIDRAGDHLLTEPVGHQLRHRRIAAQQSSAEAGPARRESRRSCCRRQARRRIQPTTGSPPRCGVAAGAAVPGCRSAVAHRWY